MRLVSLISVLTVLFPIGAFAETADGTLMSIDAEKRTITLDSGVIFNLGTNVVLEGLTPGQIVRVSFADGTIDATAVDVLENPAIEPSETPAAQ